MRPYHSHLDWLKAVGITLIVYGHVATATTVTWTPPVYPKQLGVAFFVCAMGFTLRTERRARWQVVYNRVFEVLLFGLIGALFMSVVGAVWWSDLVESNYLPLALGVNVFMDDFPANPTTWYIGTYFHLLLLWALVLRNLRITGRLIAWSCVLEIFIRAMIIASGHRFVAYMLLTNWVTLLLTGLALAQRTDMPRPADKSWTLALLVLMIAWPLVLGRFAWDRTFPFMTPIGMSAAAGALMTSVAVSAVYLAYTYIGYEVALQLPRARVIQFLARNTLIIFIAHMPLYYALESLMRPLIASYFVRVIVEFLLCLFGLAIVSESIRASIGVTQLRDRLAGWLENRSKYRLTSG